MLRNNIECEYLTVEYLTVESLTVEYRSISSERSRMIFYCSAIKYNTMIGYWIYHTPTKPSPNSVSAFQGVFVTS